MEPKDALDKHFDRYFLGELECGDGADVIDKVQPTMRFDATKKEDRLPP